MKLGDAISKVATPIASALNMPCVDPITQQLRPESGCAQRRDAINQWHDYFFNRAAAKQTKQTMTTPTDKPRFTVTRTFAVVAATDIEALTLTEPKGEGVESAGFNVRPEPKPQTAISRMPGMPQLGSPMRPQVAKH
jgi:hypothetical protein